MGAGLAGGARTLALALLPVALVLSHRNTLLLLVLIGASGLAALWRSRAVPPRWAWPFLALSAYLALSSAWTPSAEDRDWAVRLPVFVLLAAAAVASARTAGRGGVRVFAVCGLAACVAIGFEGATGGLLRDVVPPDGAPDRDDVATARGAGLAVTLFPAVALCLVRTFGGRAGGALAGVAAACVLAAALRFDIAANALAFLAAGLCAGAAAALPRLAPTGLLAGLGACFVLAPLAAALLPDASALEGLTQGPLSWRQRLVIWRTVADAALADPLVMMLGAGQHASAALADRAGVMDFADAPYPLHRVPSHPHDVFLQVWYEAGVLGCGLAAAGFGLAARALSRRPVTRPVAVAAAATLGAVGVFWAVDASLWTLWRSASVCLAAYGLVLAATPTRCSRTLEGLGATFGPAGGRRR